MSSLGRMVTMKNTLNCLTVRQLLLSTAKAFRVSQRKLKICFTKSTGGPCHRHFHTTMPERNGIKSYIRRKILLNISLPSLSGITICNYSLDSSRFSVKNDVFRQYLESLKIEYNMLHVKRSSKGALNKDEHKRFEKLTVIVETYEGVIQKHDELEELKKLQMDDEMKELAEEEKELCTQQIQDLEETLVRLLTPENTIDESDIILEVESGAGGQEAMLFAQSMYEMYQQHAAYKGWEFKPLASDVTDLGGIRSASAAISGPGVYREMKFEGGVHRVQRFPVTDKSGRIHTSTISVVIFPQPKEIDITIHPNELRVETMAGSSSGGQHAQKNETAVRLTHIPTGIVVYCIQERSQHVNKKLAMAMLRSRLYNKKLVAERGQVVSQRKIQVGQKDRSEKIRTYNFPQGRVTDHRIGQSVYNIDMFMQGGAHLDAMIQEVLKESRKEDLEELLEQFERQTKVKTTRKDHNRH